MAVDWNVLKADYLLHHELTFSALAEKYDVDLSHLGEVASREHWVEERALRGAQIHEKALAAAEINQVEELAEFDSDCLRQAKAILGTVSIVLAEHRKPHEIRSLAVAVEAAQRIGRLCLGAATQTTQQLPPAFDVEASRQRVFNEMLAAQDEAPSNEDPSAVQ
jgi:hypothetical protein